MKLVNFKDVKLEDVNVEGARKTKIRWLIAEKDKAPTFAMRMFEVEQGGNTPYHHHSWEHEVFCLEGSGILVLENEEKPFKRGDVIFIDPNMPHQFRNAGDSLMRFLCIIPLEKPVKKEKKTVNPFASGIANNC